MADIVIRGVGIPKPNEGPYIMWVYPDGKTIVYSYTVNENGFGTDSQKVIETKAIPMPEGHGRLIDVDAAIKEVFDCRDYLTETAEAMRDTKYLEQAYGVNEAAGKLLNVPTIIEAEAKEDG